MMTAHVYTLMCNPLYKFNLPLQFCVISFFFVIFPYFRYSLYLKFSFLAAIISLIVLCLYNIGKIVGFGYFGYYSFTFPVFFISVGISRHILRDWNWPAPQAEDQKRGASWKNKWSFIQSKHHKYIRKIQSYVHFISKRIRRTGRTSSTGWGRE